MSSSYVRDDKAFRERIQRLADSGLILDRTPQPCKVWTGDSLCAGGSKPAPNVPQRHRLAEFVAGLVWWSPFIAIALAAIAGIVHLMRGVR